MAPMDDTSALDEPEMPPKSIETRMLTMAVPPGIRPTMRLQNRISFFVMPPSHMNCAMMTKNGQAIITKFCRLVTILINRLISGISRYSAAHTAEMPSENAIGILISISRSSVPIRMMMPTVD